MKSDTPAKPKLTREQALVMQIFTAKARGKQQYATAGAKQTELRAICPAGMAIVLPDGRKFAIVDTFADKELAVKMTYIDRFELKELKS